METTLNLPQLQRRQIGKLQIIDIKGDLTGCWINKVRAEIKSLIQEGQSHAIVFNLRKLNNIDSLGVKALVESLPANSESGLLKGNLAVMDMVRSISLTRALHIFKNEDELIKRFGKQLVEGDETDDKRKFHRIHTALPLQFSCRDAEGHELQFHAVITNLSAGGLFAEYIDVDDAVRSQAFVSPYELTLLDLSIKMLDNSMLHAKGKVVRRKLDGEQVGIGIEFYEISDMDKERIMAFLN